MPANDLGFQSVRDTPDNIIVIANAAREGIDASYLGPGSPGENPGASGFAAFDTADINSYTTIVPGTVGQVSNFADRTDIFTGWSL